MSTPTWGYAKDGTAKLYELEDGETLPIGWADTPAYWTAEAVEAPAAEIVPAEPVTAPEPVAEAPISLNEIIATKDKAALDEFAASHGVKLDRRQNFDRMLAEFGKARA